MSELIHYSNPQSRGMRTQVILDTFEIPHREEFIDFKNGGNKEASYLQVHPYGRVPALVDGDLTVVESGAITLYLADKFAAQMGTPAVGTPERARFYEWVLFFQSTLEPVATESFTTEDKSKCADKVKELLQAVEPRLGSPFALGQEFTVVDVVIGVELTWYKMLGLYPQGLKSFDDYLERVGPRLKFPQPSQG